MASPKSRIEKLPNEILAAILTPFSAYDLLQIAPVNNRFYCLITRLLHHRLLQTAPLPDNRLILECYHPSDQLYTPYLACQYQNVSVRDGPEIDEESLRLGDLKRLYASFRPVLAEENRRPRRIRARFEAAITQDDETPTQGIDLDEGELFSQLITVTNLVKQGPKRGLFISHVNIIDSVVRIFRTWLSSNLDSDATIWVGSRNSVGIKFGVVPTAAERMPLMSGPDDDPPVSYKLVYKELLVRAWELVGAVEESEVQEVGGGSGKTLVIHGAW